MRGNILETENQQDIINDVIELKNSVYFIKLKQIQLRITKNTTNWSDFKLIQNNLCGRQSMDYLLYLILS